jgi:dTDP-4-dehydrorhamnose 3,5-epimerase
LRAEATILNGCYVIQPDLKGDKRGWLARTFCKDEFAEIGHHKEWLQINHSYTAQKGSIRGMHFQYAPHAEIKLVRCIAGSVFDVAIDLRKGSPTFLKWFGTEISAANKKMMYLPEGFAHGFQVTSPDSELIYHHTAAYAPASEGAVRFDDPLIGIDWPLPAVGLSEKDVSHPLLNSDFKGIGL